MKSNYKIKPLFVFTFTLLNTWHVLPLNFSFSIVGVTTGIHQNHQSSPPHVLFHFQVILVT